jgi:hypothetical protein
MADLKISQLTGASTPLAGTEVLPVVQSGVTKQVSVANLTTGRSVATGNLAVTGTTTISSNVAIGTSSTGSRLDVFSNINYDPSLVAGAASGLLINNAGQEISFGGSGVSPFPNYIQSRTSGIAWTLVLNPLGGTVGIGTTSPSASAILDAQSTTKGVRMPNMTTTQKNAIASPAAGLMVFDTTLAKLCVYSGVAWQTITSI